MPSPWLGIDESRTPHHADPGAGGRHASAGALDSRHWGSPTLADSKPERGPLGPVGCAGSAVSSGWSLGQSWI
eukprot:12755610-Alexandrium_andersonii.AAC.1